MKKETKRDKFVRLAEKRVNNTLKEISLIANLSNKSNYDYNQSDVEKIIRTLKKSVNELEQSFASKNRNDFRL